jgi:hypothetical protein
MAIGLALAYPRMHQRTAAPHHPPLVAVTEGFVRDGAFGATDPEDSAAGGGDLV